MNAYDVVLLPTMGQAVAYRKAAATRGDSLFGVTVSTFEAWVADLWELYGDGRAIASRLQREALLRLRVWGLPRCRCCAWLRRIMRVWKSWSWWNLAALWLNLRLRCLRALCGCCLRVLHRFPLLNRRFSLRVVGLT